MRGRGEDVSSFQSPIIFRVYADLVSQVTHDWYFSYGIRKLFVLRAYCISNETRVSRSFLYWLSSRIRMGLVSSLVFFFEILNSFRKPLLM